MPSLNRFLYAEANPTTFTDPTGHFISESEGSGNNGCRYRGDPACGATAASPTTGHRPAAKKPTKPGNGDSQNGGGSDEKTITTQSTDDTLRQEMTSHIPRPDPLAEESLGMLGPCGNLGAAFGVSIGVQVCGLLDLDHLPEANLMLTPYLQATSAYSETTLVNGTMGAAYAATGGLMYTNARVSSDLGEYFANVGGSAGFGTAGSADLSVGQAKDCYQVVEGYLGAGPGAGLEIHGGPTYTFVLPFNLKDVPVPFGINPFQALDLFRVVTGIAP